MNNKKRGEFLRKARENKNLTQEELGNLIFYSDKTISAWEKGIYTPSNYETIIKLSEVLEISPLSILYGENNVTEEKQVSSYFEIKKQFKLKILLLTILFLLSLLIILISYYYTNLKDNSTYYHLISTNDNINLGTSFYLKTKNTSVISLNKIVSDNNKYIIKDIELYTINNNKKIKILSGANEDYFLENNNISNEYNIKNLLKKELYLIIKTYDNQELTIPININKKDTIFKDSTIKKNDNKSILIELGFEYIDGLYKYKKDNITITYSSIGDLTLIKENKNNNEYLTKRIKNNNIFYKKITKEGKYEETELLIKEKKACNLHDKKEINDLAKCLNYLAWKLNNEEL